MCREVGFRHNSSHLLCRQLSSSSLPLFCTLFSHTLLTSLPYFPVSRKLHNTIQELKGNIRVFCRVRPLKGDEATEASAIVPKHLSFPDKDEKQVVISMSDDANYKGTTVIKDYDFSFDRVFGPTSTQEQVFEEISQLVQSALDGYNICIFAYGQTGSGKTHTMEGGRDLASRGMIPRTVEQVFVTSRALKEKGWEYTFQASFLEVSEASLSGLDSWLLALGS